ncbi:MAG: hypothetical protein V2G49_06680 [bacterium JZ-2024 1]
MCVFIPAVIFDFLSSLIVISLPEPIAEYLAFILFSVPAICLIALFVAEGTDATSGP